MKKIIVPVLCFLMLCSLLPTMITAQPADEIVPYGENNQSTEKSEQVESEVILYVKSNQAIVNDKQIKIDEDNDKIVPVLQDGRTLVPLRFISESLGADVSWDNASGVSRITIDNKTIELTKNSKAIRVLDGTTHTVTMDTTAKIINDRLYVPVRYVSELFDKKVFYDRGLIIISDTKVYDKAKDIDIINEYITALNGLVKIKDKAELDDLMSDYNRSNTVYEDSILFDGSFLAGVEEAQMDTGVAIKRTEANVTQAETAAEHEAKQAEPADGDYSATNVQVEGVDEGDIIKTDGNFVYYLNSKGLNIIKTYPAEEGKLLSTTSLEIYPKELYLMDNKVAIIGGDYDATRVIILDTTNKENPTIFKEFKIEASYISSRRIGDYLYLISNNYYYDKLPYYVDEKMRVDIAYNDIYCFPTPVSNNVLSISAINIKDKTIKTEVTSYVGGGETVYASQGNLYVAVNRYDNYWNANTEIYKFNLNKSNVTYAYKGYVYGGLINQFAMDEHNDYFRVATTSTSPKTHDSVNNMFVLDEAMEIVGELTDVAPTERIYSVRFMGDRAFMVTFKQVDPLFVIDLKQPKKPTILGELKIPGYSTYLHPYDENHLMGFGYDTKENEWGGAINLGMKMSMFDVSDLSNPKELFVEYIGDRGTYSPILDNHRALLFNKDKNLLAFPVEVYKSKASNSSSYGEQAFQGAFVYSIDISKGFIRNGEITHAGEQSDPFGKTRNTYVDRIIYIGNNLYTFSDSMMKINDMKTIAELAEIDLY